MRIWLLILLTTMGFLNGRITTQRRLSRLSGKPLKSNLHHPLHPTQLLLLLSSLTLVPSVLASCLNENNNPDFCFLSVNDRNSSNNDRLFATVSCGISRLASRNLSRNHFESKKSASTGNLNKKSGSSLPLTKLSPQFISHNGNGHNSSSRPPSARQVDVRVAIYPLPPDPPPTVRVSSADNPLRPPDPPPPTVQSISAETVQLSSADNPRPPDPPDPGLSLGGLVPSGSLVPMLFGYSLLVMCVASWANLDSGFKNKGSTQRATDGALLDGSCGDKRIVDGASRPSSTYAPARLWRWDQAHCSAAVDCVGG